MEKKIMAVFIKSLPPDYMKDSYFDTQSLLDQFHDDFEKNERQCDYKIVRNITKIKIIHKENSTAKAEITLSKLKDFYRGQTVILYSFEKDKARIIRRPIFLGECSFFRRLDGDTKLFATAICYENKRGLNNLYTFDDKSESYNNLIAPVYQKSKVTGYIKKDSYNCGENKFSIFSGNVINYSQSILNKGVKDLNLSIIAAWNSNIIKDLSLDEINKIATFSSDSLEKHWPREGQWLNKNTLVTNSLLEKISSQKKLVNENVINFSEFRGVIDVELDFEKNKIEKFLLPARYSYNESYSEFLEDLNIEYKIPNICQDHPNWKKEESYYEGDVVYFEGLLYQAVKGHVACDFNNDRDNWSPRKLEFGARYKKGDLVINDDRSIFFCLQDTTFRNQKSLKNENIWGKAYSNPDKVNSKDETFFIAYDNNTELQKLRIKNVVEAAKNIIDSRSRILERKITVPFYSHIKKYGRNDKSHAYEIEVGDIIDFQNNTNWPANSKVYECEIEVTNENQQITYTALSSVQTVRKEILDETSYQDNEILSMINKGEVFFNEETKLSDFYRNNEFFDMEVNSISNNKIIEERSFNPDRYRKAGEILETLNCFGVDINIYKANYSKNYIKCIVENSYQDQMKLLNGIFETNQIREILENNYTKVRALLDDFNDEVVIKNSIINFNNENIRHFIGFISGVKNEKE